MWFHFHGELWNHLQIFNLCILSGNNKGTRSWGHETDYIKGSFLNPLLWCKGKIMIVLLPNNFVTEQYKELIKFHLI